MFFACTKQKSPMCLHACSPYNGQCYNHFQHVHCSLNFYKQNQSLRDKSLKFLTVQHKYHIQSHCILNSTINIHITFKVVEIKIHSKNSNSFYSFCIKILAPVDRRFTM